MDKQPHHLDARSGRVLPSDSASKVATGFQSFRLPASRQNLIKVLTPFLFIFLGCDRVIL